MPQTPSSRSRVEQLAADAARVEVAAVHADVDDGTRHAGVARAHERLEGRLAGLGQGEREDRRGAPVGRAERDGVQVGERVRVRIDASREHEAPARVDGAGSADGARLLDRSDAPVAHDQVAIDDAVRRHDAAAADREIGAHGWQTGRRPRSIQRMRAIASVTVSTAATPATPKPRRAPPWSISTPDSQPPMGEPARNAK